MISNVKPNREEYTGFQGNVPNWWVMLELSLFLLLLNYNFIRISFSKRLFSHATPAAGTSYLRVSDSTATRKDANKI